MTEKRKGLSPEAGGEVSITRESFGETRVSMQLLQDVYNELTGKTEELQRSYDLDLVITYEDLAQLNYMVGQACEQYNMEASNCSVTIYHEDKGQETFSSFERFKIYNRSSNDAVESIILRFNFLVVLPQARKPQSYSIEVRLFSALVGFKGLPADIPPDVFWFVSKQTARIKIEFVDYMVAKNFMGLVDSWIKGLDTNPPGRALALLRRWQGSSASVLQYIVVFSVFILVYVYIPVAVPSSLENPHPLLRFLLVALMVLFVAYRGGRQLGNQLRKAVYQMVDLSYINLTKGDQKLAADAAKKNRYGWIRILVATTISLILGTLSSLLAYIITS